MRIVQRWTNTNTLLEFTLWHRPFMMWPGVSRPYGQENTNIRPRYGEAAGYLHYLTEQRWVRLGMEGGWAEPFLKSMPTPLPVICRKPTVLSFESWSIRIFHNSLQVGKYPRKGQERFWASSLLPVLYYRAPGREGKKWGRQGDGWGGKVMGGQPKSTSHFHTQVHETGDAKDTDVTSPQAHRFTGAVPPSGNQEQRKPIFTHWPWPASGGSDLHSWCQSYSSGGCGGDGGVSPAPYSMGLVTETAGWTSLAPPGQPRFSLSGTIVCRRF